MATAQYSGRRKAAADEDPAKLRAPPTTDEEAGKAEQEMPRRTKRVAALDIFRGLTVAMMILVDGAGGEWPVIGHAPWNGCNLADFVMPFFLFIVGMAVPLALKRMNNRVLAVKRVIFRTIKLFFWGLILQGGYSHAPDELTYGVDMKHIRWCGILQRIALAYLVVAFLEIFSKTSEARELTPVGWSAFKIYCWQCAGRNYIQKVLAKYGVRWELFQRRSYLYLGIFGACILVIYLATLYATYVPDWTFTLHNTNSVDNGKVFTIVCGVKGRLDPPCNAVGYIDRQVLGINHMYQHPAWKRSKVCTYDSPHEGPFRKDAPSWCLAPFEPEGILSSISSILSAIIGVHYGHVLLHMKSHLERLKHWVLMGFALLILGILLHFTHAIPLNKQLYSFSYVCTTAGAAGLVFSVFYILVDILHLRALFLPFEWIGMNAMLVFVMAAEGIFEGFLNGWYFESPNNTLADFSYVQAAQLHNSYVQAKSLRVYWIKKHIFVKVWHSTRVGVLLYVIFAQILFWALVAGVLHRLRIYWKM